MIGERENISQNTNYGTLVARSFNIEGNTINAFYDTADNLIFVLDNTVNSQKNNVLLVINPDGDKKWDEILSSKYGVDLEDIRPKVDNKYQKLDIEYSGLPVYESLINAYNDGDDLNEYLNQLAILRDSAVRHSAMVRLNAANEIISKTNATIIKTKETIVRLEVRIKTLRSKLSSTRKEIGKVATKQSASKILKLESQIDATNEKLKRAKKRLESAQKRLDVATVDAELATNLLKQPSLVGKVAVSKNKTVAVVSDNAVQTVYGEDESDNDDVDDDINNSDIKPLFKEEPQILNEDIAFKPISFDDTPNFNDNFSPDSEVYVPENNSLSDEKSETHSVLESITPIAPVEDIPEFNPGNIYTNELQAEEKMQSFEPVDNIPEFVPEPIVTENIELTENTKEKPVLETMQPVLEGIKEPGPIIEHSETQNPVNNVQSADVDVRTERTRPGFIYYLLLVILIVLSVFTLWLYQKSLPVDGAGPVLVANTQETADTKPLEPQQEPVAVDEQNTENVFLDDFSDASETVESVLVSSDVDDVKDDEITEDITENEPEYYEQQTEQIYDDTPIIEDVVPDMLNTSVPDTDEEIGYISEEEVLANKPVYETGSRYDEMFVDENNQYLQDYNDAFYYDESDPYFDAEEAAYQSEAMY